MGNKRLLQPLLRADTVTLAHTAAPTVKGQNLTHQIADRLGVAIVTGVYSADNPIPIEANLCRQFNASRSVLREAVKMLTAKGLLTSRPRVGTLVEPEQHWNMLDPDVLGWLLERKFSPTLLMEFTEFRLSVEPGAASLAARMAGPAEKTALRAAIARMQAADSGGDDPLDSDIAFHVAVLNASRNRFYAQLTGFIATALRISIRTTNRYKGVQASVADHKKVADAIIAGHTHEAGDAMRKIIKEVLDLIHSREELQVGRKSAANTGR
jgi:DNA-binding FadR family transcriptional regulator